MDTRYFVVAGACLTQFTIIGLFFTNGLLMDVFEREFGWSRALVSTATSLGFVVMGVMAMFCGRLSDRFGPRLVLGIAGVSYGIGFALLSQINAPWQMLVIFGLFLGLGMSTHDVVTLSTIARWFKNRRGIMTGITKTGTATGQILVPPLAALLIAAVGWRDAVVMLGLAAILLLMLAAYLIRQPPKPVAPADGSAAPSDGLLFAEARRSGQFWRLCAMQFLFFPTLTTVPLHIVVHGIDMGMTPAVAAWLLSAIGAASIAGRLTIGGFSDRIGGRNAYILCFALLIAALSLLIVIKTPWPLFAVMVLYGIAHGGFFTVVAPTVAEYFGTKAHGAIFGVVLFFGTIGGAVGPVVAGKAFDIFGTYDLAFAGLAGMAVIGLLLAVSLPRPRPVAI